MTNQNFVAALQFLTSETTERSMSGKRRWWKTLNKGRLMGFFVVFSANVVKASNWFIFYAFLFFNEWMNWCDNRYSYGIFQLVFVLLFYFLTWIFSVENSFFTTVRVWLVKLQVYNFTENFFDQTATLSIHTLQRSK